MPKLPITINKESVTIGDLTISFQRTLRIPDDGNTHSLPPSLGQFPVVSVQDYKDRVPAAWRSHGGIIIPMHQSEAMWMSFNKQQSWRPAAVKVGVGMVDALTGENFDMNLSQSKTSGEDPTQNYMVVPGQPWLDGIKQGNGTIRQFIATPLGSGHSVEGQVTGEEKFGGLQIVSYLGKESRFPKPAMRRTRSRMRSANFGSSLSAGASAESFYMADEVSASAMGLGAGGQMQQKIYADAHGIDAWDTDCMGRVFVHIVNAEVWTYITGQPMPHKPLDEATYSRYGFTWYGLYDSHLTDIKATEKLKAVKSVQQLEKEQQGDWTVPTVAPSNPGVYPTGPIAVPSVNPWQGPTPTYPFNQGLAPDGLPWVVWNKTQQ